MRDILRLSAVGSFSLRKIALILLAGLVSAPFVLLVNSASVYADNASWGEGDTLSYNGQTYTKMDNPPALPGMGNSDEYDLYSYKQNDTTVQVIAIKKGSDATKDIGDAKLYTYDFDGTSYTTRGPPEAQTVTVSAKTAASSQPKTSCAVPSIGWIICGVAKFIATGMDKIFDIISGYLEVKPVSTATDSGLFQAWNIARGLANLCFIAAFLIIIYAQITTIGINNYEIKKMIPRLIVAAVLVNVSYFICGLAVDVSNILGDSIAKGLTDIRHSLPSPLPDNINYLSWQNLTEYVMSGGAVAGGFFAVKSAFLGSALTAGSTSSLPFLLFPILISGALAVLVAVLLLAARQALITVLIIGAPLAFVAYLLPNTEKWFGRWRELFTTMLMVFPLFSLLFGGAQLASFIIIQNADQVSTIIFAMFVQVAPLFLTPFLIRVSGSLLGKLAGQLQGQRKGLTGRARDWGQERAKMRASQAMRRVAENGGVNGRGAYMQRRAFKRQLDKKYREGEIKSGEEYVDAAWHNDSRYHRQHRSSSSAQLWKSAGEATSNREFEAFKADPENRSLQELSFTKRLEEARVKRYQSEEDSRYSAAEAGYKDGTDTLVNQFADEAYANYRDQRIADSAASRNKAVQSQTYAKELSGTDPYNLELQVRAGGIDRLGAVKVKSETSQEVIQAGLKNVDAIKVASDLSPGDVPGLLTAFNAAVDEMDVDSMRAYADMLAESRDFGVGQLRDVIIKREDDIRSNNDVLETFRHYVNSNEKMNKYSEDIAVWSRDNNHGYRRLSEIQQAFDVWKNLTPENLARNKASSQTQALMTRDDQGNWAVSRQQALDILKSPAAWSNVKPEMKRFFRARAMGQLDYELVRDTQTGELKPKLIVRETKTTETDPPKQRIEDRNIPEADRNLGLIEGYEEDTGGDA